MNLFDYIRRATTTDAPGTLAPTRSTASSRGFSPSKGLVAGDAVMNAETLPAVEMPARDIFVPQER